MRTLYINLIIIFFISISGQLMAEDYLNLSLIHKKGINKGLILVSELHLLEEIRTRGDIILQMKNGYMVKLTAVMQNRQVLIKGKFFNGLAAQGADITKDGILLNFNEEKNIELKNSGDQVLLLRVMPRTL